MAHTILKAVAALLALGAAFSAQATTTRTIYISPATMSQWPVPDWPGNPMLLSNTQDAQFRVNLLLPLDYTPNTAIKLRLYLRTGSAPCSVVLGVSELARTRAGLPIYSTHGSAIDGMNGSVVVLDLPEDKIIVKQYGVNPPKKNPSFSGQKPADGLLFVFWRNKQNPLDTCPDLAVWNAEVRYEATP